MLPNSKSNSSLNFSRFVLLLVGAAIAMPLGARSASAQQGRRPARTFRASSSATLPRQLNNRQEDWRQMWFRDAADRISSLYTEDATLIPPGAAPQARSQEEIQSFFEKFLPTVGEVQTSIMDLDVSNNLAYVQGRFFYDTAASNEDGPAAEGVSGTYLTVFRREGRKWKIRLQLFRVEEPGEDP